MAFWQDCIPGSYSESIYKIDYQHYAKQGITTLFFDLDNTIIDYNEVSLDQERIDFILGLLVDFKVVIISNSKEARVKGAVGQYFNYVSFATKPFRRGFKKALAMVNSKPDETLVIGDQLLTDIQGANKMKMQSVLVKPVASKTDRLLTKFNRLREQSVINKIKLNNPKAYQEVILPYEAAK